MRLFSGKMRWVALAVAVGLIFYWQHGKNAGGQNATPAVRVTLADVRSADTPLAMNTVGTVVAYQTVAIKSRLDTQVTAVKFRDGDLVKEGQVLFELDDRATRAQIHQQEANLEQARAQLVNAQLQYKRAQTLNSKGFATPEKLDETRATFASVKAQMAASAAQLDNARVLLDYTVIKAPITARAGTINVTLGNNVKANDAAPLVTLNQVQPIRVQMSLPQRYFDMLRDAMNAGVVKVVATRNEGGESSGTLDYIDNAIDATSGTVAARARFENADEKLWPGMFVNVAVTFGVEQGALIIPNVAVQTGQEGNYVFVVEGDTAHKRKVEVARTLGENAIIKSGLTAQDKVVVDGLLRLADSSKVEVVAKDEKTEPKPLEKKEPPKDEPQKK